MFRTTKNNKTNPKNTDNFNILCRPFEKRDELYQLP